MVVAATAAHGVALQDAQAGRGLARVDDASLGALGGGNKGGGLCGDGGEALRVVQSDALGLQDGASGTRGGGDNVARGEGFAIVDRKLNGDFAEALHGKAEEIFAAEHAGFAGGQVGDRARLCRDERLRGQIAPGCVFIERHAHEPLDVGRCRALQVVRVHRAVACDCGASASMRSRAMRAGAAICSGTVMRFRTSPRSRASSTQAR